MLIWLYSLAINLYLWLNSLNLPYSSLPLIFLIIFGLYDVLYKVRQQKEYAYELMLASVGICIVLLILVINIVSFSIYLAIVVLLYLLKKGKNCFIYPPFDIRIANAFSFISSILTYLLLHASIKNEVEKGIPLIPFSVNVLTEIIILIKIYRGNIDGLAEDFCKQLAYHRALFSASTIVFFIIAILFTMNIIPDFVLFSTSTIFHALVLIYINVDKIKNVRCKSRYAELKR